MADATRRVSVRLSLDDAARVKAWLRAGRVEPRPLAVARVEALPLVVQEHRARISKDGEVLDISVEGAKVVTARLAEVSQVAIYGNAALTTPALHELMRREIPVSWHSHGGWFLGHTIGLGHRNVEIRTHQWRKSFDPEFCLRFARGLVAAKIRNGRTLLRRNWRGATAPDDVLAALDTDRQDAEAARDLPALLGIEGLAARRTFSGFAACLAPGVVGEGRFDWEGRNRRPPTDPVNALLSFTYAMLVRVWTVQPSAVGLDAYRGFYHQPRYGRPALAAFAFIEGFYSPTSVKRPLAAFPPSNTKPDQWPGTTDPYPQSIHGAEPPMTWVCGFDMSVS